MPKRIILNLPDDLIERLDNLASEYGMTRNAFAAFSLSEMAGMYEHAISMDSLAQAEWLAHVEPQGRA